MNPETIIAIITAAQQLIDIAMKEKALLAAQDQASVDTALATLRANSDAMHIAAQSI